ncbi:MAG TPA: RidA family protein [Gemmatimonadaceae bacterium]|nr:RidA family protein [Gemmatimonadaceae bacterium]
MRSLRAVLAFIIAGVGVAFFLSRNRSSQAGADSMDAAAQDSVPIPPGGLRETVNGITYHMPYGRPTRPFTPAVQVGDVLYLAGQIGTSANAQGGVVPGGIQAETRQTMENIRDVLEKSGSSMDRVFKCTVFMADMREWDAMNEVYTTFFPNHKPARSALGASGLALNARVEIECLAKR